MNENFDSIFEAGARARMQESVYCGGVVAPGKNPSTRLPLIQHTRPARGTHAHTMTNSIVCDVKISASLEMASRNLCRMASSEPNNCPKIFCDQLVTRWQATGHRTAQFSEFWKMLVLEPPLKLNFNAKKHFTTFL